MSETVTRIRATDSGSTDAFNQPVPGTPTETDIEGALFAPGGSVEPNLPGAYPVVTSPTLYWRNEWPDITAADKVRVRGVVYDVIGDPQEWIGDGLAPGGLVVELRKV